MKPRIRYIGDGRWECFSPEAGMYGHSPEEAWELWSMLVGIRNGNFVEVSQ